MPGGIKDVFTLIDTAKTHEHKAIIGLCGLAGLRIAEALAVQTGDLVFHNPNDRTTLRVRGKGDKMREVPISPKLWTLLAPLWLASAMPNGGPLISTSYRSARSMITRCGRRAKIPRVIASHDLRMTFATAVYDSKKDIRLVQQLLGHSDTKTTIKYISVAMESMQSAVAELSLS